MIKRGPVDVLVVAAGNPRFDGSVFEELKSRSAAGIIRVLDAMVLVKGDEGRSFRLELKDLPSDEAAAVGFIPSESRGLFSAEDEQTLAEGMVAGSAIFAMAIEHTWAIDLVNKLEQAGVEVAFSYRVPASVVDEAMGELATESMGG